MIHQEILLIMPHSYVNRRIMNLCDFPTKIDLIKQIQLFDYSYLFIIFCEMNNNSRKISNT